MTDILKEKKKIIFKDEVNDVIKKFKKIGTSKRKNASIVVDNKKYSNIHVFSGKDAPIMSFCEKIRKGKDILSVYANIDRTLRQYKDFESDNEFFIKSKYVKQAIEIAQRKYKILDLLVDRKIDIFVTGKKRGELKSYLYKDWFNQKFEILIYADKDAIYTTLYQLGSILSFILCDEDIAIPKDFIKVNKKIKVNLLDATREERKIIFSDIFAVTALKNTQLEEFVPFSLQDDANKILEDYFIEEIGKRLKE